MNRRSASLRSESKCLDDEQRRRPEKNARPGSRFCHDRPPRRGHTTHERKIIADESFLKTHIRLQAFQVGRGKLLVQRQRLQLFYRPVFTAMLHYHPALIEIQIGMTAQDLYRHPIDQPQTQSRPNGCGSPQSSSHNKSRYRESSSM